MTTFYLQCDSDEHGDTLNTYCDEGAASARIATAREDGERFPGPLSWLNSARVTVDPEDEG